MHKRLVLTIVVLLLLGGDLASQVTLSPYSRYGLGDLYNTTSTRNFSMGNVGIGTFDASTINRLNPASYADLAITTVDMSGFGLYSRQNSQSNSVARNTGGFHNLSLGFSNKTGFGIVFGLAPYSSNGYQIVTSDSVLVDTAYASYNTTYNASGGLNQFYIGTGIRFLKNFRAGANLNIAFGNTNFNWNTTFNSGVYTPVNTDKRVSIRGVMPQFGLQYGDTLIIRKKVEQIKVLQDQDKGYLKTITIIDKDLASLNKENEKLLAWKKKQDVKIEELAAEKKQLEDQVTGLMTDERGNKNEIGKLQDKAFRVEKKRKKLVRESKAKTREIRDATSRMQIRKDKLQLRRDAVAKEIQEIEEGKRANESERRRDFIFRLGTIFEPSVSLNGERLVQFDNLNVFDTLFNDEGSVKVPMKYGFGLHIGRPNRWSLALDASVQDWSTFQYFDESNDLTQALSLNLGGEWTPDVVSPSFAKRIAYRAGVYYQSTALNIDGQPVNEMGVNFGFGIPIGRFNFVSRNFSRLNIGFGIGKRGDLDTNPLEELTFQFRVGFNLNERWFVKRRID